MFDDASAGGERVRVYREPAAIVEAHSPAEIPGVLAELKAAKRADAHVAGYLAYEAGAALNARVPERQAGRLAWFGVFERAEIILRAELERLLPDPAGARIGPLIPRLSRDAYLAGVEELLALIRAGDLYQANYTFGADLDFTGDPLALYARLRRAQRAAYSAIVATGDETILSLSPELFFAMERNRIICRPMKGTAARPADPCEDDAVRHQLSSDPKQRAENLMIVDLMRNDLSRIAEPGSVAVPELFSVEAYPTLFQMVSAVTATCRAGIGAVDVLAQLFPCGSVTGAPKIRAMQVIHELETEPRGAYTGAIGYIDPGGSASFNVAIRTLRLEAGATSMRLGLGSGIVADSDPAAEWEECLAKARFLGAPTVPETGTVRCIADTLSHRREAVRQPHRVGG